MMCCCSTAVAISTGRAREEVTDGELIIFFSLGPAVPPEIKPTLCNEEFVPYKP